MLSDLQNPACQPRRHHGGTVNSFNLATVPRVKVSRSIVNNQPLD